MEALGADENYLRTQTDVGIEPAVFAADMAYLRADPSIAAVDEVFANGHWRGVSVGLSCIARLLLTRAIATNVFQFRAHSQRTSYFDRYSTDQNIISRPKKWLRSSRRPRKLYWKKPSIC